MIMFAFVGSETTTDDKFWLPTTGELMLSSFGRSSEQAVDRYPTM